MVGFLISLLLYEKVARECFELDGGEESLVNVAEVSPQKRLSSMCTVSRNTCEAVASHCEDFVTD